jgi:hypothetical protein
MRREYKDRQYNQESNTGDTVHQTDSGHGTGESARIEHPTFESEREVTEGVRAEGVVACAGQHGGLVQVGHPLRPRGGYQQVYGELTHVADRQRRLRPRNRRTKSCSLGIRRSC